MDNSFRRFFLPEHERAVARREANSIPPLFDVAEPVVRYIHAELRCCYYTGLDHAAILTAAALVERGLKVAIVCDIFSDTGCDPKVVDDVETRDLARAAQWAKQRGLLSKDEWRFVDEFREHVRNCWMHGSTPQSLKDTNVPVGILNLTTHEVSNETVRVGDTPVLRQSGQVVADARHVDSVVALAHCVVCILSANVCVQDSLRRLERDEGYGRDNHDRLVDEIRQKMSEMEFKVTPPNAKGGNDPS